MKYGWLVLAFALCGTLSAETNDVIHSIAELVQVISRKGAPGRKFAIEGTVYSVPIKPKVAFFIVRDGYGVPLVDFRPNDAPSISPGDRILASGTIDPRHGLDQEGYVNANCRKAVVLGQDPPTRHIPITANDIDRKELRLRPIRIVGTLVDMRVDDIDPNFTIFVLDCSNRIVYAESRTPHENLRQQIGAMVSMEGILGNSYGLRIHSRMFISVQKDNAIKILKPPSNDWFQAPGIGAADELSLEAVIALGRRKASGRVLAVWNDDTMLLRTSSNNLVKVNLIVSPPSVGAHVDVVGIAETDLFHINLSHAIWREANNTMPQMEESTHDISTADIIEDAMGRRKFNMTWHGRRIRLRGKVRDVLSGMRHGPRVLLEDGRHMATIDCNAAPSAAEKMSVGCIVSVTGVCVMDTENWNHHSMLPKVTEMFLSVSSPDDIKILAHPPWWTPFKLMVVIGVLLLLLVAFLIWNASLRILSERRGREMYRSQIAQAKAEMKTDERTRLAAELHDHLAQNLTAISYQIAAAERSRTVDTAASAHHLDTASRMLGSCRTELRRCLWDLRSDALDEADVNLAIRKSIEPIAGNANVHVEVNAPRAKLSDSSLHATLSIIRELAANAVNHGQAKNLRITGELAHGTLQLSVTDDGCGFDTEKAPGMDEGHFGLGGVRERVRRHNGEMSIESAPGKGTSISVTLNSQPSPLNS